jgi:hypothetical protein
MKRKMTALQNSRHPFDKRLSYIEDRGIIIFNVD